MALRPCVECGKEISTDVRSCPSCGKRDPHTSVKGKRNFWLGIGAFFLVMYAISSTMPSTPDSPSSSSASTSSMLAAAPESPPLALTGFSWGQESESYVVAHGQVKNVSGESLKHVLAVITYTDAQGNFVTSDDAVVDFDPVLPGQATPFTVTTRWNPAMNSASVQFKESSGGTISSVDSRKRR